MFDRRQLIGGVLGAGMMGLLPARLRAAAVEAPVIATASPRVLYDGLRGGEGPCVLPDGRIAMVEFTGGTIVAISSSGGKNILASPGLGVAGNAIGPDGALYVAKGTFPMQMQVPPGSPPPAPRTGPEPEDVPGAIKGGALIRIDPGSGTMRILADSADGKRLVGPNDLVFDRYGDIWFSDFQIGALYWATGDGSQVRKMVDPLPGANGVAISPDGRALYVALNRENSVAAFRIAERGTLADGGALKRLATVKADFQFDGLKVEANGNLVAAAWEGGLVSIAPDGRVIGRTEVPGLSVINCCFGGPDMRTLYCAANPAGSRVGKLIAIDWPRPGLKLHA